jgi:hypothetical protein
MRQFSREIKREMGPCRSPLPQMNAAQRRLSALDSRPFSQPTLIARLPARVCGLHGEAGFQEEVERCLVVKADLNTRKVGVGEHLDEFHRLAFGFGEFEGPASRAAASNGTSAALAGGFHRHAPFSPLSRGDGKKNPLPQRTRRNTEERVPCSVLGLMLAWLKANGRGLRAAAGCAEKRGRVASVVAIVAPPWATAVRARSVVIHRAPPVGFGSYFFFVGFLFLCGTGTPAGVFCLSLSFW